MTTTKAKTYTRKIGQNRGKPRLWLEGAILMETGFTTGLTWDVYPIDDGSLRLLASNEGGRKIAGHVGRPIIDINSAAVLAGFNPGDVVQITAQRHLLTITKLEG